MWSAPKTNTASPRYSSMRCRFWNTESAVPGLAHPHLGGDDGDEGVVRAARPPGPLHVLGQRLRLVLREDVDRAHPGVRQIGEDEVDDPVAAAEGDGRLGAIERERKEARALAAGHDQRDEPLLSVHRWVRDRPAQL